MTVGLNQGQVPLAGWLPGVGRGSFWAGGQKAPQIKNKSSPPGWIKAVEWMEVSVTGAERGRRWMGRREGGKGIVAQKVMNISVKTPNYNDLLT